jgi:ribosomal protein S18 acetylase RimI-like enzyme
MVENETEKVAGYYTLAAGGVPIGDLPEQITKRLPRYPSVPVARIVRLAVDLRYRGRKLSDALIANAIQRSIVSDIAVFAVVVDAKDDALVAFYRDRGFISLPSARHTLFLPLSPKFRW